MAFFGVTNGYESFKILLPYVNFGFPSMSFFFCTKVLFVEKIMKEMKYYIYNNAEILIDIF